MSEAPAGLVVARITITRTINSDDGPGSDLITAETDPPELAVIESLGMLRLAEGLMLEMGCADEEDDE